MSMIINFFRNISLIIDGLLATLIDKIFDFILTIVELDILGGNGDEVYSQLMSRVYLILGIFVVFKIGFILTNYIIKPEDFANEQKGAGGIAKKTIMMLVLLVLMPHMFTAASYVQTVIIGSDTIPTLIFGISNEGAAEEQTNIVSYSIYSAFITPNAEVFGDTCKKVYVNNSDANSACLNEIKSKTSSSDNKIDVSSKFSQVLSTKQSSKDFGSFEPYLLDPELVNARTTDGDYVFDYYYVIPAVVGIVTTIILLNFIFDLIIRMFKLLFLQIISPLAIVSMIDPKATKDSTFGKWFKAWMKTYLDVFIRLIALFFALYMIGLVTQNWNADNSFILQVLLIIGALMFAKMLPKLIEDITGFKFDSKGLLVNPAKRLMAAPGVNKVLGVTGGALGGMLAGGLAGKDSGHVPGGILRGGLSGGFKGNQISSFGGGDASKNQKFFHEGAQQASKSISGKDFTVFSASNVASTIFDKKAEAEIKEFKKEKRNITEVKSRLDREYNFYQHQQYELNSKRDTMSEADYKEKLAKIDTRIKSNREAYGKASKNEKVFEDQINDLKKYWKYDDSSKRSISEARSSMEEIQQSDFGGTIYDDDIDVSVNSNNVNSSNNNSNQMNQNTETRRRSSTVNRHVTDRKVARKNKRE